MSTTNPGLERINRFIVAHAHGEVTFADPTEADLIGEKVDVLELQITVRCGECGATIRERVSELERLGSAAQIVAGDVTDRADQHQEGAGTGNPQLRRRPARARNTPGPGPSPP